MANTAHQAVEFVTSDFEFAHGKRPSGQGGWAFAADRHASSDEVFWVHGLFSAAKKQAARMARARGVSVLFVLS